MERVDEVLGDGFMVEVDVWGGGCCSEAEIPWLVVGIGLCNKASFIWYPSSHPIS